ncbi:MAG: hypothetical protein M9962_11435 [Oligoflexia bacterium]|nr:hypothetical protein [Oligoflexia bacterium]
MKLIALLSIVFLASCAGSSSVENDELAKEQKHTDECLENPELAQEWGSCNVKSVIYKRLNQFERCLGKKRGNTRLLIEMQLYQNGNVRGVKVLEGKFSSKAEERCMRAQLMRLRFAKPPKGQQPVITLPFDY